MFRVDCSSWFAVAMTLLVVSCVVTLAPYAAQARSLSHQSYTDHMQKIYDQYIKKFTTPSSRKEQPSSSNPQAILNTEYGIITFELFPADAPKTVANFIYLAQTGVFNNSMFYRNAKFPSGQPFVVQGGLYNSTVNYPTVPLEYKLPNDVWTVGLARAEAPNTGNTEYFINLNVNNSKILAPGGATPDGYCVFAKVVAGFPTVTAMVSLPSHYSQADGMNEFDNFPTVYSIDIIG